jgi:hypothetical protein
LGSGTVQEGESRRPSTSGTQLKPSRIVRIIIAALREETNCQRAVELNCSRASLSKIRKRLSTADWFQLLCEPPEVARHATGGFNLETMIECLPDLAAKESQNELKPRKERAERPNYRA